MGVSGNTERAREVEALTTELEHTQLAKQLVRERERKEGGDPATPNMYSDSPGLAGIAIHMHIMHQSYSQWMKDTPINSDSMDKMI